MSAPLKADGFDSALIGVGTRCCGQPDVLVYDYDKSVAILQVRDGMTREEAMEYLDMNVLGAWMGTGTPMFVKRCTMIEAIDYMEQQYGAERSTTEDPE